MTGHRCPFCGAALNMAEVPPGVAFRCGGCDQPLEAGESRLSMQETRAYRGRQRVRRLVLCMIVADLAAALAWFIPLWPESTEGWVRWMTAALAAMVVGPALYVATGAGRAPVPVAPAIDKVHA